MKTDSRKMAEHHFEIDKGCKDIGLTKRDLHTCKDGSKKIPKFYED